MGEFESQQLVIYQANSLTDAWCMSIVHSVDTEVGGQKTDEQSEVINMALRLTDEGAQLQAWPACIGGRQTEAVCIGQQTEIHAFARVSPFVTSVGRMRTQCDCKAKAIALCPLTCR